MEISQDRVNTFSMSMSFSPSPKAIRFAGPNPSFSKSADTPTYFDSDSGSTCNTENRICKVQGDRRPVHLQTANCGVCITLVSQDPYWSKVVLCMIQDIAYELDIS